MDKLIVFNHEDLSRLLNTHSLESKFGKYVKIIPPSCNIFQYIETLNVDYVLLGIPGDLSVLDNQKRKKSSTNIWEATLKVLLNIPKDKFTTPENILILGYLNFDKELKKINSLDVSNHKQLIKARKIISRINKEISYLIYSIKKTGKTPIIIGGVYNNAYGIIKGNALAKNSALNIINFDSLIDFKPEDDLHNRNGFTNAYREGFLNNYYGFGLQEKDMQNSILKKIKKIKQIKFSSYESIEEKHTTTLKEELKQGLNYIKGVPFGIEINCNIIQDLNNNIITSPDGFSLKSAKKFTKYFAKRKHVQYLHIYKTNTNYKNLEQTGKHITHLITDFILTNSK